MEQNKTVENILRTVEKTSTEFEEFNTDLKRRYLLWNIEIFNAIVLKIKENRGSFGTGYPFYALDDKLEGKLPIIQEQIRYNRQLVREGEVVGKSIWLCESCIKEKYSKMPDLKKICKPCPNMLNSIKPRKIINRLPDMDLWMICEDGKLEQAKEKLSILLDKNRIDSSDKNPLATIEYVSQIVKTLKSGEMPKIFLPIDAHIIELSQIKELIEKIPNEIEVAKREGKKPYLPINPMSYRKYWQHDDEAYNFVFDYLATFKTFNVPEDLQKSINKNRRKIALKYSPQELFEILLQVSTESAFRRFQSPELKECFLNKAELWKNLEIGEISIEEDDLCI